MLGGHKRGSECGRRTTSCRCRSKPRSRRCPAPPLRTDTWARQGAARSRLGTRTARGAVAGMRWRLAGRRPGRRPSQRGRGKQRSCCTAQTSWGAFLRAIPSSRGNSSSWTPTPRVAKGWKGISARARRATHDTLLSARHASPCWRSVDPIDQRRAHLEVGAGYRDGEPVFHDLIQLVHVEAAAFRLQFQRLQAPSRCEPTASAKENERLLNLTPASVG